MYWVKLGKVYKPRFLGPEREQLAGAFVIDPKEGSPPDRIFVMNIWMDPTGNEKHPFLESLTINGRSWPYTELIRPAVGGTLRWRIINASNRNHPMHLHGFYYDVLGRGNVLESTVFREEEKF